MKLNNRLNIVKSDVICPKCNEFFERRSHKIVTSKMKKQPFYYSEWDFCRYCNHVQHYEKYKIRNINEINEYVENRKELGDMTSLFNNI